jgi:type IV pilus biogenesis protein CpaD/CtpE
MKRLIPALLLVGITGCNPDPVPYPSLNTREIDLKHDTKVIEFTFGPGKADLSEEELGDLRRQISTTGLGRASVHATFPARAAGIHRRRIHHIIRSLMDAGLKDKQIHFANHLPRPCRNTLSVVFDTYRAIPPICPNWSKAYGGAENELHYDGYGCSDKHNLVQSVDDPVVFFKSTRPGHYDTVRPALGIQNYQIGKEKKIKMESTTTTSSSGSSGGGS